MELRFYNVCPSTKYYNKTKINYSELIHDVLNLQSNLENKGKKEQGDTNTLNG